MPLAAPHPHRRHRRVVWLYGFAILREFRHTLFTLATAVVIGAVVYHATPGQQNERLNWPRSIYHGWMALLAQPRDNTPPNWSVGVMCGLYPVLGFILIGEGIVRLALLMISRRHGQKEWMRVMASTYRDHIVLCGLGHLGLRVLQHLHTSGLPVVVLEVRRGTRQLTHARELGVAVLIRDMKEDQALIDAGVQHARAIIICTNDDMANLEVALDARRLNPKIRVVMRLYDQQIASKISGALNVDAAFSSSALAAPVVAALSLQSQMLSSHVIGGVQYLTTEIRIEAGCPLDAKRVDEIEIAHEVRVLARTTSAGHVDSPPSPALKVAAGDMLVLHARASRAAAVAAAGMCRRK